MPTKALADFNNWYKIPDTIGYQMPLQVHPSPNICFYTTWGKQNKRKMHWNEQQTSRNWRLDRTKFWSQRSELMKYIVYLLTAVLPAIKRVTGDTFMFQQYSAPAHRLVKRSNCWSAKPRDFISPDLCSPTALTSMRSITSSGDHATARLSDDVQECGRTQEATSWNLDRSGAEHYWHCYQMEKTSACLCSREGPTFRTFTVGSWTTGQLDKRSARVTEM